MADEARERVQVPLTRGRARQQQVSDRLFRQKGGDARLLRLKEIVRLAQPDPKRLLRLTRPAQLCADAIEKLQRREFAINRLHSAISIALSPNSGQESESTHVAGRRESVTGPD